MSDVTMKEVIDNAAIINTQLEILKYIGGKNLNGQASGEGVSIDIVLLPDIVLDIRKYNLNNSEIDQKCIAIGGRSGRVACILAHLTELSDGFYRTHLVSKTGNLGKLLIENEFYNKQDINESRKLISYISEREGEPRVTVWNDSKGDFQSKKSFIDNEISANDIISNEFLKEVIKKCRVIYFSSIKTPNFEEVLNLLLAEIRNTSVKIFIDCTRSDINHLTNLLELFSKEGFITNSIEGIIVSKDEKDILDTKLKEYKDILRNHHIGMLFYSNSKIEYFDQQNNLLCKLEVKIDFDNEDIPERFKSGFIIAKSLCETIKNLNKEIPIEQIEYVKKFGKHLNSYWEKEAIRKMIMYGIGIVKSNPSKFGYCNLESILKNNENFFPKKIASLDFSFINTVRNCKQLEIKLESFNQIIKLAGYRRQHMLSQHENIKRCHKSCQNYKDCKFIKAQDFEHKDKFPYTAIMIDLDGTLMDSSVERNRGLNSALKIINQKLPKNDDFSNFFESYVYNYWPLFKALDKGDFRQEWNVKGWYIVYIMFSLKKPLLKKIQVDYDPIPEKEKNPDGIKEKFKSSDWIKEFNDTYMNIGVEYGEIIEAAISEFNNIRQFAFKETFDFLRTLKDSGNFNLYIVSEGNSETQWLKLKSTGLTEFFPRTKVLTTDDAANLNRQMNLLNVEGEIVQTKTREITADRKNNLDLKAPPKTVAVKTRV